MTYRDGLKEKDGKTEGWRDGPRDVWKNEGRRWKEVMKEDGG